MGKQVKLLIIIPMLKRVHLLSKKSYLENISKWPTVTNIKRKKVKPNLWSEEFIVQKRYPLPQFWTSFVENNCNHYAFVF